MTTATALAYTVDEAAEMSRIGRTRLYDAISSGALVARKYGRRTLILRQDLEGFLQSRPVFTPRDAA